MATVQCSNCLNMYGTSYNDACPKCHSKTMRFTNDIEAKVTAYSAEKVAKKEGIKNDSEKPRMDLLDNYFLLGLSRVLTFGAAKYSAQNWRKGIVVSRLIAAAYRHLGAFNSGEDNDPESGIEHLFHAGCSIMFAAWTIKFRPNLDDRYSFINDLHTEPVKHTAQQEQQL